MSPDTDVIIIGGGLAGASFACALDCAGLSSIVIEPVAPDTEAQPSFDERTIALTCSSRQLFAALGVWPALEGSDAAWPIFDIDVAQSGTAARCRLSRDDLGLDALGYVVPARIIGRALHARIAQSDRIRLRCPASAAGLALDAGTVAVTLDEDGQPTTVTGRLAVLADGGRSSLAADLGFDVRTRQYSQSALITTLSADTPHTNLAHECFTADGPLALLPMRSHDFAVAWTLSPERLARYMGADDDVVLADIQRMLGANAAPFTALGERRSYPLSLTRVEQSPDGRILAIGNAAHTVHPVAGQGFNLSLRDAAALARTLSRARSRGADIGAAAVIGDYLATRRDETRRIEGFTDAMIGAFAQPGEPLRAARGQLLALIDRLPAAKRALLWRTTGLASPDALVVDHVPATTNEPHENYDVAIVGAGLVGGAMACALSGHGLRIALIDKSLPRASDRTAGQFDLRINAYNRSAEQFLRKLGVWQALPPDRVFPFRRMTVCHERGRAAVGFEAADVGATHLGHFIENDLVTAELVRCAQARDDIDVLSGTAVETLSFSDDRVYVTTGAATIQAALLIGADGAQSRVRHAAGIAAIPHPYRQRCIVATVKFSGDLDSTAWQRFLVSGPLGLLPLAPGYCSLAWSCAEHRATELLALGDAEFGAALERASDGRLGRIQSIGPRAAFSLTAREAATYAGPRTALIGDAAHVVHPLAGLGANIGFKDALMLSSMLLRSRERGRHDVGSARLLRRYSRARRAESRLLMSAMTGFNTVFSNDDRALGAARDLGLRIADNFAPAKRALIRRAMWMDFVPLGRAIGSGGVAPAPHPGHTGQQA